MKNVEELLLLGVIGDEFSAQELAQSQQGIKQSIYYVM